MGYARTSAGRFAIRRSGLGTPRATERNGRALRASLESAARGARAHDGGRHALGATDRTSARQRAKHTTSPRRYRWRVRIPRRVAPDCGARGARRVSCACSGLASPAPSNLALFASARVPLAPDELSRLDVLENLRRGMRGVLGTDGGRRGRSLGASRPHSRNGVTMEGEHDRAWNRPAQSDRQDIRN